jgi:hypothetical protein
LLREPATTAWRNSLAQAWARLLVAAALIHLSTWKYGVLRIV